MLIDGIARVFRDIKAKNVVIDGILKLRRASLYACKITCDGIIIGNREVSADEIIVDGICSVSKMYGDKIILKNNQDKGIGMQNLKVPVQLKPFLKLYLGRDISTTHSIVDVLECTNLEAEDIKAKVIRANNVKLKGNCVVDKLFCDGEIFIDDTCQVKKIISKNQPVMAKKEMEGMANASLVKILDLYKDGKINADEAEKMISSLGIGTAANKGEMPDVPWKDDGKLRIVAYIGRKLLRKGDPEATHIEVKYDGEALNVESYGNLICGNINGNASTGGSITCGDIGGNVTCGGSIRCKSVNGNIAAGGGVHIER